MFCVSGDHFISFRCGKNKPPAKSHPAAQLDIKSNGGGSKAAATAGQPTKRGLERELEELVAGVVVGGPSPMHHEMTTTRSAKRAGTDAQLVDNNNLPTESRKRGGGVENDPPDAKLIFCCKSDCPKTYHLRCLDLTSPPSGGCPFFLVR